MAKWYCTHCCIKRELYTAGASPVCVLYTKWQSGGQWWWWWWCKQIPAAASLPSVKSENTIQSLVCLNGATGVRMWNAFPLQHKHRAEGSEDELPLHTALGSASLTGWNRSSLFEKTYHSSCYVTVVGNWDSQQMIPDARHMHAHTNTRITVLRVTLTLRRLCWLY